MILSVVYLLARCLLDGLMALARREASKDAELLVLRRENAILRRQISRVRYQPAGRLWLSALSRLIPRHRWGEAFAVTPATLLAWHRRLVTSRCDYTSDAVLAGRPDLPPRPGRSDHTSHPTRADDRGRCPLYVRAQLDTAGLSWTQRDLVRQKATASEAGNTQLTGHFRR